MRYLRAKNLSDRQICIAAILVLLLVFILVWQVLLKPAYQGYRQARKSAQDNAIEARLLELNLAIKTKVNESYAGLDLSAFGEEPEQVVLSQWLRDIESKARYPGMVLTNMKPVPVVQKKSARLYGIHVSVVGRLPDIVKFVDDATHSRGIVGIESFTIRGKSGMDMVDASFTIQMVRFGKVSEVAR